MNYRIIYILLSVVFCSPLSLKADELSEKIAAEKAFLMKLKDSLPGNGQRYSDLTLEDQIHYRTILQHRTIPQKEMGLLLQVVMFFNPGWLPPLRTIPPQEGVELDRLPSEILVKIATYLSPSDRDCFYATSSRHRGLREYDSPSIRLAREIEAGDLEAVKQIIASHPEMLEKELKLRRGRNFVLEAEGGLDSSGEKEKLLSKFANLYKRLLSDEDDDSEVEEFIVALQIGKLSEKQKKSGKFFDGIDIKYFAEESNQVRKIYERSDLTLIEKDRMARGLALEKVREYMFCILADVVHGKTRKFHMTAGELAKELGRPEIANYIESIQQRTSSKK